MYLCLKLNKLYVGIHEMGYRESQKKWHKPISLIHICSVYNIYMYIIGTMYNIYIYIYIGTMYNIYMYIYIGTMYNIPIYIYIGTMYNIYVYIYIYI